MMKYRLYTFLLFLLLITGVSCTRPDKDIEFKDIRDVTLTKVEGTNAYMKANAYFFNPNTVGMKLRGVDIDVSLEGKKIAKVNQEKNVRIPPLAEFSVPLEVKFNIKDAGLLNNIFGFLSGKQFDTHYEGYIKASFRGVPFRVAVDHHEPIKFRR